MGLTARLLRAGAARPRLLLVAPPGTRPQRLAVERLARQSGWPAADGPADGDVLVLCGPAPPAWQPVLDELWRDMAAPRTRVELTAATEALPALRAARAGLADVARQRREAALASRGEPARRDLPMADVADDRDGLRLDQLHVTLGPVLPAWPHGLRLRVALQGDVLQSADVDVLDGPPPLPGGGAAYDVIPTAAARLDGLARLLTVAGWPDAAAGAARARDAVLAADPSAPAAVARLARRLRRSRLLAAMTAGLGVLAPEAAARYGLTGPVRRAAAAGGDVRARWRQWLVDAEEALAGGEHAAAGDDDPAGLLDVLPGLVTGLDLAAARLVVASLDPDLSALAPHPVPAS